MSKLFVVSVFAVVVVVVVGGSDVEIGKPGVVAVEVDSGNSAGRKVRVVGCSMWVINEEAEAERYRS